MDDSELSQAIFDKDITKINFLLTSGKCLVNQAGPRGYPLIVECLSSRFGRDDDEDDTKKCEILKLLVRHGTDVNIQGHTHPYQATAAMVAAQWGHLKCLQLLVESGADLRIMSDNGNTALMLAARGGHEDCVKYLIKHLPHSMLMHRDKFGRTALMVAASYREDGCCRCVEHLIDAGSNLDLEDRDGDTALMLALQCYSTDVATLLLENGACVNTVSQSGETPLKLALQTESDEVLALLLAKGAHVNDVTHSGETPLTVASIRQTLRLLQHGLDPTLSHLDRDRLHNMVKLGQKSMLRGLVRNGFPPLELSLREIKKFKVYGAFGVLNKAMSPLSLAILSTDPDIAKYLIVNHFFTTYDIVELCWDREILHPLQNRIRTGGSYSSLQAARCLEILEYLSTKPQSLRHLCLISISSVLSQDLSLNLPDTLQGKHRWMCKPTFVEKVDLLEIPPSLKRALLHQTESAAICCRSWGDISLEEKANFSACHCQLCEDNS
ncbi:ankyrin repeat-containing protein [Elysia marginata]|uniref:Ankyrin repeat-containing protein n=1 Tax=Elysia marginata TaxID=1093978 RepID=A0AAV4GS61_9GAST|nr:ankyrin repeat-containing protein [Elysia marginata]